MREAVVEPAVASLNPALQGLTHLASVEGGKLYVYCWGPTDIKLWQMADGPATCLHCWTLGPKEGWRPSRMFGGRERWEMEEGRRWLSVDTETKENFTLSYNGGPISEDEEG